MLTINKQYVNPEEKEFEIVERKGVGHPDTLADALAEEVSRVYSKYCLEKFGAVLHHNIDKLYIGAGWNTNSFGSVKRIKPIKVVVNGRISNTCNGEEININQIMEETIKEYVGVVLPHLDVEKDLDIIVNTTQHTRVPYWFSPRTVDDVPDAKEVFANDTSVVVSYCPYTTCERLAFEIERFFWEPNEKGYPVPKFNEIGQDIKVMVSRINKNIDIIVCMPVISTEISSREEYYETVEKYEKKLQKEATKICKDTDYNVKVSVNAKYDNDKRGTLYMLALGTSAECGEEGLVGRGNSSLGIISTFRPNSMEAPAGKNPRYHTGRVLGFLSNRLSKAIYNELGLKNQIVMLTRNKYSLVPPYLIYISVDTDYNEDEIKKVIDRELNIDYTVEILKHRSLF